MMSHVFRPLYVVAALVAVVFFLRMFIVPKDFGTNGKSYIYGWHRKSNEEEWKNFRVKYRGSELCKDCHSENHSKLSGSPHFIIQCENCHGPALDHPVEPSRLGIEKSNDMCLRCHALLPYKSSGRRVIRQIDDTLHNPGTPCISCHNPHSPGIGGDKA